MTLNIVVPCYNEEPVLPETSKRLVALLERLIAATGCSVSWLSQPPFRCYETRMRRVVCNAMAYGRRAQESS